MITLYRTSVSWKSKQGSIVALTTIGAEYEAAYETIKEDFWLESLQSEINNCLIICSIILHNLIVKVLFIYVII